MLIIFQLMVRAAVLAPSLSQPSLSFCEQCRYPRLLASKLWPLASENSFGNIEMASIQWEMRHSMLK